MEIPKKTLEDVKKVVLDIFDNGKVKDVSLQLGYDSLGQEVIWVGLHVEPGNPEAFRGRLIRVPYEVSKVLDGDLKDLHPFVQLISV